MNVVYFLDASAPLAMDAYLKRLRWLDLEETVVSAGRAGEGNMNCTLRVHTARRTFILKQSRPWCEKFPHIPAPEERALIEAAFYREVGSTPSIAERMPRMLGFDEEARVLMLEDLGTASDFTGLYSGEQLARTDLAALVRFAADLHGGFTAGPHLTNLAMRKLNHEYIFELPLAEVNRGAAFEQRVRRLGELYLGSGPCLLHGDYFPGSWLRVDGSVKVIDPEFCFFGPAEFEIGVMLAHLYLARQPKETLLGTVEGYRSLAPLNELLTRQFAGVEIIRRLVGVSQLPLPYGAGERKELLELAVRMTMS